MSTQEPPRLVRSFRVAVKPIGSRDPLGLVASDFNLHRYVGNNPIIYVDPSGLHSLPTRVGVGAATGAAFGAATGAITGGGAMMSGWLKQ